MSRDGFARLGQSLADLEQAWQDRLADAEALPAAGRNALAIATGLYAVEIRLKTVICLRLDLEQLPRAFEVRDLPGLLTVAGLSRRIERKPAKGVRTSWDAVVALASRLNDFRYKPDAGWTAEQARKFFRQLRDPPHGVLLWLGKVR
jgi:hypothetical protein